MFYKTLTLIFIFSITQEVMASWRCHGHCSMVKRIQDYVHCGDTYREICERAEGEYKNYAGSCGCYYFIKERESITSAWESTRWLAKNEVSKKCKEFKEVFMDSVSGHPQITRGSTGRRVYLDSESLKITQCYE